MLVQINQHQDQETSDRSRISTRPPVAWVTVCATRHLVEEVPGKFKYEVKQTSIVAKWLKRWTPEVTVRI